MHKKVQIENRVYPVAGRYHLRWQADRQWSVRQQSVPPAGPARWSAAPEEPQRMESPQSVILITTGHLTEENTAPGSVLLWWPPGAAGWWSAEADPADPGAAESDHPEAGSDLAAPAGSAHGNNRYFQNLSAMLHVILHKHRGRKLFLSEGETYWLLYLCYKMIIINNNVKITSPGNQ